VTRRLLGFTSIFLAFAACGPDEEGEIEFDTVSSALLNASFVSENLPTTLDAGERLTVRVQVRNENTPPDGSWPTTYALRSVNVPSTNEWRFVMDPLLVTTPPGEVATFDFVVTAPAAGANDFRVRMFTGTAFFGPTFILPSLNGINVVDNAQRQWDCAAVSNTVPDQIQANASVPVSITVQNTGLKDWLSNTYCLRSMDNPLGFWGVNTCVQNAATVPNTNGTVTFTFTIRAPSEPGFYPFARQMFSFGPPSPTQGVGVFDLVNACFSKTIEVITSGTCGNDITEPPSESCDDGNTTGGDGCSATCQIEPRVRDLATQPADRHLIGASNGSQLGNNTIGQLFGDAAPDLVTSELEGRNLLGTLIRNDAGTLYGYPGGAGFFSGPTTVPAGATFAVVGGDEGDGLGALIRGRMFIRGDINADGQPDLVASAPTADGVANGRLDAGEVFVIRGGAGLTGTIDLVGDTMPAQVIARIVGPSANAQLNVLDVRDANNDGRPDILVGAPFDSPGGRFEAGTVFLISGGASLSGTIDLATETTRVLARFEGQFAGDRLGSAGALGDFGGTVAIDVLLGADGADPGVDDEGIAYGIFGPVSGNVNLANADVTWVGTDANGRLGTVVRISNIRGSTREEAIISGFQMHTPAQEINGPPALRGGVLVFTGPVSAGTINVGRDNNYGNAGLRIFGEDQDDTLGSAVAASADLNGDGYRDLVIGMGGADGPGNTRTNAGGAIVVVGGQSTTTTVINLAAGAVPPWTVHGSRSPGLAGRFRQGVAAGDLDNDGRADFCVGESNGASGDTHCLRSPW
jgi:cysteine-rich repeat protein